jgi:uncharacterized protein YcbK (DUF882 family)
VENFDNPPQPANPKQVTRAAFVLLALLVGSGPALAHARPHAADTKKKAWPSIELDHLTTHERFFLRPDKAGHLGGKQLRGIRNFLRCHHTGRVHAIADRLPQLLYVIGHHFGDRAISIVAGYRAPKIAKEKGNPRSPHKAGLACDFKIDGVELTALRDYVRNTFEKVGVGYYPNSGFVHLDVGRKANAFWIDYSYPGGRAEYSADPIGDLKSGRADGGADPPPPTVEDPPGEPEPMVAPQAPPAAPSPEPRPGADPD